MSFIERTLGRAAQRIKKNETLSRVLSTIITSRRLSKPSAEFQDLDQRLQTMMQDRDDAFEQYKALRTMLLNPGRQTLITSPGVGEGKTTTAINLAICIALGLEETALLIDGDMRKPQIHKMLGLGKPRLGLANFLRNEIKLPEALLKTSIPKLSLLPAGPSPVNPSELINSRQMSLLLQETKSRYPNRFIIIDSPPVNQFTDALILSLKVDGVLLVARAGQTRMATLGLAIAKLKKANLLGVVLNGTQRSDSSYYYYAES